MFTPQLNCGGNYNAEFGMKRIIRYFRNSLLSFHPHHTIDFPHFVQNFAPARFGVPHVAQ